MSEDRTFTLDCPACLAPVTYTTDIAGSAASCPHCGAALDLPPVTEPPDPSDAANLNNPDLAGPGLHSGDGAGAEGGAGFGGPTGGHALDATAIATAFRGSVRPPPATWSYRFALFGVTAALLLLPLVYLALVVGLAWFLVRVATGFFPWWERFTGGISLPILAFGLYGSTLFFGALLVLFLTKPLFARPSRRAPPLTLNPAAEPLVFAFVHMVCDAVGAPRPIRVDIDCRLNASAGFREGVFSPFRGGLVLTLGLPLVAGLDLRALAGVLAHEFGHFNQRVGMRASYLIRRINAWFARLVHERDAWDDALDGWAMGVGGLRTHVFGSTAQFFVAISREILSLLMHLGNAVSCAFLRQMELGADLSQIDLAGSEEFERTFQRIRSLGATSHEYYRQLRVSWNLNRRLPANLPLSLAHAEASLPDDARRRLARRAARVEIEWFDTHPPDSLRLDRARARGAPGVFHLDGPATRLFSNFDVLARQVTVLHYEEDLGLPRSMIRWVEPDSHQPAGPNSNASPR